MNNDWIFCRTRWHFHDDKTVHIKWQNGYTFNQTLKTKQIKTNNLKYNKEISNDVYSNNSNNIDDDNSEDDDDGGYYYDDDDVK